MNSSTCWLALWYILGHVNGWRSSIQLASLSTTEQMVAMTVFFSGASSRYKYWFVWPMGENESEMTTRQSHTVNYWFPFVCHFQYCHIAQRGKHIHRASRLQLRKWLSESEKRNPKGHFPGICYYIWYRIGIVIAINCHDKVRYYLLLHLVGNHWVLNGPIIIQQQKKWGIEFWRRQLFLDAKQNTRKSFRQYNLRQFFRSKWPNNRICASQETFTWHFIGRISFIMGESISFIRWSKQHCVGSITHMRRIFLGEFISERSIDRMELFLCLHVQNKHVCYQFHRTIIHEWWNTMKALI